MSTTVAVIPGDGIGQEVVPATIDVLQELPVDLEFVYGEAGDHVKADRGVALPDETRDLAAGADATLFGAAGETAADVILPLRETVDSFANVRPARAYPGVDALRPDTDLVFIRENTEGVYAGIEAEIADGVTTLTRVITDEASRRIARFGFEYATEHGYDSIAVAHKANVMRTTDGQFLDSVAAVAADCDVEYETVLMDALAMHLALRPEDFGVIICPNLAGDVLSDLAAGLVGGLGLLPSANLGTDNALFEPVHGSAPDIAGEGIANPAATMFSAAMMLDYLEYPQAAQRLRSAVETTLEAGPQTPDLGGDATTADVTDAVIEHL